LLDQLVEALRETVGDDLIDCRKATDEVTVEVAADQVGPVCRTLRDHERLRFGMLIDLCGVDYLQYGQGEWETDGATASGFGRGVTSRNEGGSGLAPDRRFAVVYHLLSLDNNWRLRVRVWAPQDPPRVPSVTGVWPNANWFEREAFDLFGVLFEGHPDLRRILTDYGFIGHPFRKDFPLIGNVEMRYDAEKQRVVYQPVSIEPRVLVPRVVRDDSRYLREAPEDEGSA
jgi:NADH-quinone oxidoreductase subunit C